MKKFVKLLNVKTFRLINKKNYEKKFMTLLFYPLEFSQYITSIYLLNPLANFQIKHSI